MISLLHCNARSWSKNKEKLEENTLHCSKPPDVIALQKTLINRLASLYHHFRYNFIGGNSQTPAKGVSAYIKIF